MKKIDFIYNNIILTNARFIKKTRFERYYH